MQKSKIVLLIEDDPKTAAQVKDVLSGYEVEVATGVQSAASSISKYKPALIVLDHDLKGVDGLQAFRQLHILAPLVKIILISESNDIPLAVAATKLGAADFLKKPLNGRALAEAVKKNLQALAQTAARPRAGWLRGQSPALERMYAEIQAARATAKNILLVSEKGIDNRALVEFIHASGPQSQRRLRLIDLADFQRENLEAAFWAAVREATAEDKISPQNEEDRCGTLCLDNFEGLEENFRLSILDYFKQKREKSDQAVLTIVVVKSAQSLGTAAAGAYAQIAVPALRERKEDLPALISRQIGRLAGEYDKNVTGLSAELLFLLSLYDFPGNYAELESLLETAVLRSSGGSLELKDLPLNYETIKNIALQKARAAGRRGLEEAKNEFERLSCKTAAVKTADRAGEAARFFDIPRTVFAERLAQLGEGLLD